MDHCGQARPGRRHGFLGEVRQAVRRGAAAGHRHRIGAELAGSWNGRPAVVLDLDLATDYGSRGEDAGGVVRGRFHVAAVAVSQAFGWWAMTRQDVREHLPPAARGARLPGTGRLERVLMLTDPGALPAVPPPVIDWVGREVAGRRIGVSRSARWSWPASGRSRRSRSPAWSIVMRMRPCRPAGSGGLSVARGPSSCSGC
jgi:hypothetical protein